MSKRYRMLFILASLLLAIVAVVSYREKVENIYNSINSFMYRSNSEKKLVFGRANDSISLDPAITTDIESFKVTVNIFETLVKYEQEGNEIIPCLAESWKSSEDGLTWVFRLRQGVRFHDGTVFDAYAVEFNFHRWMDAENPYHMGQFKYWNYIFGGYPGFIKSVTALSDYTLEIVLTKPYSPFLSTLALPVFGIISPEAIKKYGQDIYKHPVGTGPFRFKSWDENKSIVLLKNERYWAEAAKVDKLEFRVIPCSRDRLEQLKEGTILIADNLDPDNVNEVVVSNNLFLYLRPSFNVGYMAINNQKPPFSNRTVRAAINHAINKEQLIKDVFNNLAKPAKTLMPPLLWGYNDSIEPYEYNPELARQLLKDAGYANGFNATLWVMDCSRDYFPKPDAVAQYIKGNLEYVNINLEIKCLSWDEYLERLHNGEHELALIGWTGDNIDPDNFLNTLLASFNAKPGMAGNYSFYMNKAVDMLLAQARETSNIVFRKNLYSKLLEIVNYDAPSVPLVHTMPLVGTHVTVRGYTPHLTGVESLEHVDIINKH